MDVSIDNQIDLVKLYQNWATSNYPSLSDLKVKHHESNYKPWYDIDRCKAYLWRFKVLGLILRVRIKVK
jgi:hypothetical protein